MIIYSILYFAKGNNLKKIWGSLFIKSPKNIYYKLFVLINTKT